MVVLCNKKICGFYHICADIQHRCQYLNIFYECKCKYLSLKILLHDLCVCVCVCVHLVCLLVFYVNSKDGGRCIIYLFDKQIACGNPNQTTKSWINWNKPRLCSIYKHTNLAMGTTRIKLNIQIWKRTELLINIPIEGAF